MADRSHRIALRFFLSQSINIESWMIPLHSALFCILLVTQVVRLRARLSESFIYFALGIGIGNAGPIDIPFDDKIPLILFFASLAIHHRILRVQQYIFGASTITFAIVSFLGSDYIIDIDNYLSLLSFVLVFSVAISSYSNEEVIYFKKVITILPITSVIFGAISSVVGNHNFAGIDSFGNFRLHGGSIAAYLSAICLAALIIGAEQSSKRITLRTSLLMVANCAILVLSGGRMPMLCLGVVVILALLFKVISGMNFRNFSNFTLASSLVAAAVLALLGLGSSRVTALDGDNFLSGREILWDYLLLVNKSAGLFGNGFGEATKILRFATLAPGTVAPHNEFIRFYFDIGILSIPLLMLFVIMPFNTRSADNASFPAWKLGCKIGLLVYALTDNVFTMPVSPLLTILLVTLDTIPSSKVLRSARPAYTNSPLHPRKFGKISGD